ncbi:MAG: adenosine deaminase [Planctomycetes bacterium]|nr:adenosine deaminase [Planctomycetota bacterium]
MQPPIARPSRELVRRAPKVLLHEHLDGGLRPKTVLELAAAAGYKELPESDPAKLADWFAAGAARGSLAQYLEGFRHTIALMQTADAIERVAYEFAEDMARDNVVYSEVRFAPHFHTQQGLGLDGVMTAVMKGLRRGEEDHGVKVGVIVCAMRNLSSMLSYQMAELAVAWRDHGVVGFDLAGEEAGHPAKHHIDAFQLVKRMNFAITIHAGESFGVESIWQALQYCGAHRIGHGTRLIEDMVLYDNKVIRLGPLAQYVLDHRIPIEICLSSNVHTGATPSLAQHPFPHYMKKGYRVTLNTDNRLMSRTSMTDELMLAVEHFGCTLDQIEKLTINGMKSAFAHYDERIAVIFERIKPGYAKLRAEAERGGQ